MVRLKKNTTIKRLLGPGLIAGAADDDPSGIATYSQAGARFEYGLLWTVFLTTPFMIAVQLISAHIGRVTGKGIAANAKEFYPLPLVLIPVGLLVLANVINIAADIAAMGEVAQLVIGGSKQMLALLFAALSMLLQILVPYHRYSPILKFSTLVLFLYVAVAFTIDIPWRHVVSATMVPSISFNKDYLLLVVAVFGTTISPYLFFWQASQEVEEMRAGVRRRPLKFVTRGAGAELTRMAVDTTIGMILSNGVAYFIVIATAVTLHVRGVTDIKTAADAAEALRPIAGPVTFLLFALGIIGTGMLAIPVLAGSAAYAFSEVLGWRSTLEASFPQAVGFYLVIVSATVVGCAMTFLPFDAMQLLIWSAVLNGVVAVPIMSVMMLIASNAKAMGPYRARGLLICAGWATTFVMAGVVAALFW